MIYFKLIAFILILLIFILLTLPFYPFLFIAKNKTRKILTIIVMWTSKAWLKVLGIKVQVDGHFEKRKNFLVVSNHLSYIDALVIASKIPSCFVTSLEVKASSFLGQLTMLAGCLFVNRKNKSKLHQEILELRHVLLENLNVTFFPEATSTNGANVIRFKRPLFEASIATGKPILPITINYLEVSEQKISHENRDHVFWYGDMSFFPHFKKLLKQKSIAVDLIIHEPFTPELFPVFELAEKAHQIISNAYQPIISPAGHE